MTDTIPSFAQKPPSHGFWRDRRTLVTGGTGLVGGWLVPALLVAGADVVCLVRDWMPDSMLLGRGGQEEQPILVTGDVRNQQLLERILGEYEIETVVHLAAQTVVGIANRNPVSTWDTNLGGTWALLEACRRAPSVAQIVVASSDKAYGTQPVLPYDETMPLAGRNPYDASKSAQDLIAESYFHTFGLPVAITRCGNFYGGGDLNWSRLVPGTIRSILRGIPPVIRSNGKYLRDYFYVEDGAAAYMLLAERLGAPSGVAGEAFNFSNEEPVEVLDVVQLIMKLMNVNLEPIIQSSATNEIEAQFLSATKARARLEWSPRFSLEEGLVKTIDWYRNYLSSKEAMRNSAPTRDNLPLR